MSFKGKVTEYPGRPETVKPVISDIASPPGKQATHGGPSHDTSKSRALGLAQRCPAGTAGTLSWQAQQSTRAPSGDDHLPSHQGQARPLH